MKEKDYILIVVDEQHDFCNPFGCLYVNGAEMTIPETAELIKGDSRIVRVIFTLDWHTLSDCSFKHNGGTWPAHCIQHLVGSSIMPGPVEACIETGKPWETFLKGDNPEHEEYGAFEKKVRGGLSNNAGTSKVMIPAGSNVIVCGVAGDYCVLETLKNLKANIKGVGLSVYLPAVSSIDGGKALKEWMEANGVGEYNHGA